MLVTSLFQLSRYLSVAIKTSLQAKDLFVRAGDFSRYWWMQRPLFSCKSFIARPHWSETGPTTHICRIGISLDNTKQLPVWLLTEVTTTGPLPIRYASSIALIAHKLHFFSHQYQIATGLFSRPYQFLCRSAATRKYTHYCNSSSQRKTGISNDASLFKNTHLIKKKNLSTIYHFYFILQYRKSHRH